MIPVELNKNNTILALTTKMSQPHEIAYQLYIGLEAAKTAGSGSGGSSESGANGSAAGAGQTEGKVDDQYDQLDEKAPEIMGLTYEKEIPVEHSDLFKIYQYADGCKLIELDMQKRTALDEDLTGIKVDMEEDSANTDAEQTDGQSAGAGADSQNTDADSGAESASAEEQTSSAALSDEEGGGDMAQTASEQKAALYNHAIYKYLIVQEGMEVPAGIDKQLFVVQLPLDKTAVSAPSALEAMDSLSLTDQIAGIGIPAEEITVDALKKAVQTKEGREADIPDIGTYDDLDYKTLLLKKMNMLFVPSEILPVAGSGKLEQFDAKTKEDFEKLSDAEKTEFAELAAEQAKELATIGKRGVQLGMGVIVDRSADEESDLAKAEWIKVYGALYGKEAEADKLYQDAGGTAAEDLEKKSRTNTGGAADAENNDTAADSGDDGNTLDVPQGTATATGVTDPVLRILNLRNKLEGATLKETTCEETNGFLYVR